MAVIEVDVISTAQNTVVNTVSTSTIEVSSRGYVANVVVSATPPTSPFEGQIWIDIS